ncbi:MAG: hypothetical protein AAGA18_02345 [Verrucomicrobiota bacterium]
MNKWYWILLAFLFLPQLIFEYDISANHVFLLFFICLGLGTIRWEPPKDQKTALKKLALYLMFVVLFFASLQKLFSSYYLSGSLLMDYILKGTSLSSLGTHFYPNWETLVEKNLASFLFLKGVQTEGIQATYYPLFPNMKSWLNGLAWLGLLLEAIIVFLLPIRSSFAVLFKGFLLLIMVLGVYALRDEAAFMAIMCSLAFMVMKDESRCFACTFLLLALIFCTMVVCDWRPALLD